MRADLQTRTNTGLRGFARPSRALSNDCYTQPRFFDTRLPSSLGSRCCCGGPSTTRAGCLNKRGPCPAAAVLPTVAVDRGPSLVGIDNNVRPRLTKRPSRWSCP
jgi:hypothetical protein